MQYVIRFGNLKDYNFFLFFLSVSPEFRCKKLTKHLIMWSNFCSLGHDSFLKHSIFMKRKHSKRGIKIYFILLFLVNDFLFTFLKHQKSYKSATRHDFFQAKNSQFRKAVCVDIDIDTLKLKIRTSVNYFSHCYYSIMGSSL